MKTWIKLYLTDGESFKGIPWESDEYRKGYVPHGKTIDQKNGYYGRSMKTRMGEIKELNVPRDREGSFKTSVLEPYSRTTGIDKLIMALYSKGISTGNTAEIMNTISKYGYSKSTIVLSLSIYCVLFKF